MPRRYVLALATALVLLAGSVGVTVLAAQREPAPAAAAANVVDERAAEPTGRAAATTAAATPPAPSTSSSSPAATTRQQRTAAAAPSTSSAAPAPVVVEDLAVVDAPAPAGDPCYRQDEECYGERPPLVLDEAPVPVCAATMEWDGERCVAIQLPEEAIGSHRCPDPADVVVAIRADGSYVCGPADDTVEAGQ